MAVTHAGLSIPGTHEDLRIEPWEYQRQENTIFGVVGTSVLIGAATKRRILVPIWIHNSFTQGQLLSGISDMEEHVGTVGTLAETGNISRSFPYCEFAGFANDFGPHPSNEIGWMVSGSLLFIQLRPS